MLSLLQGCERDEAKIQWSGETMGTYYRITVIEREALDKDNLRQIVDTELQRLTQIFSTYLVDSEVSRFNQREANACIQVSSDFIDVLEASLYIHDKSNGAFNPLIEPLVSRWGFGASERVFDFPSPDEIASLRQSIDVSGLQVNPAVQTVCKGNAEMHLDFSAIAKGYAVDQLSRRLSEVGVNHHLVDVGGELAVRGKNASGVAWRLAVEQPDKQYGVAQLVFALGDGGVATSGDYRNYFIVEGKRYSHTIDPISGYPVGHNLASVTVIHDEAMVADAWATALSVLGFERAKSVAMEQQLAVYLLERENASAVSGNHADRSGDVVANVSGDVVSLHFREWHSPAFKRYLIEQ